MSEIKSGFFGNIKNDLPASVVVFFVALPLCLGIALASGAPLFSGLIAGIIGGIVVGSLSGSQIGVSGPAAGLAAIVLSSITVLGGFENFLLAVVLGGAIQIVLGFLRLGIIGYYFPSSVIKGMLAGIGIIIILKQIPHFFGYDADPEGDFAFFQIDGENTFSEMLNAVNHISPGATIIALISISILLLWSNVLVKKAKIFSIIQGPLVAVAIGIIFYYLFGRSGTFEISGAQLVSVPVPEDMSSFVSQFAFPNFGVIGNPQIWITAVTIAVVASLETLLCVEATDKLDPLKRVTPTNRELLAQGTGNMISGLIGGLPITQVIVRSSANIQSGGKTKASAIIHGFFLIMSVVLIPALLNKIPLSVLAAILFIVGFKLAKPANFIDMWNKGWKQFLPFIITILGIVFTDLLVGIGMGLVVAIAIILIESFRNSHFLHQEKSAEKENDFKMTLAEEVTFFNKATILSELNKLPENSTLTLDVKQTRFMDLDIIEILDNFRDRAKDANITVTLVSERGTVVNPESYSEFFKRKKLSDV